MKAMFNDHAFRDRRRLSGVNSINWARIVAQVDLLLLCGRRALGAPHRPVSFAVPTGNFGDIFAGYAAKRMGLPIEQADHRHPTRTTSCRARVETRRLRDEGTWLPTTSPSMDIQVSSNFERSCSRPQGAMPTSSAADGGSRRRPAASILGRLSPRSRATSPRPAPAKPTSPTASCRDTTSERLPSRSAHGLRARRRRKGRSGPARRTVVLATAHPAKFPDAIEAITGERSGLARRGSPTLMTIPRTLHVAARTILRPSQDFVSQHCRVALGGPHDDATSPRLPNGLRVVDAAHAASGNGLARRLGGGRRAPRAGGRARHLALPRAHGVQGHERRIGPHIAEEIESVGGELNAATGLETTAYFARVLKGDDGSGARSHRRHSAQFRLRPGARREREVILQEIAASRDSPDDIVFDLLQDAAFPGQAIGRPILGTQTSVGRFSGRRPDAPILASTIGLRPWSFPPPGPSTTSASSATLRPYSAGSLAAVGGLNRLARYRGGLRRLQSRSSKATF